MLIGTYLDSDLGYFASVQAFAAPQKKPKLDYVLAETEKTKLFATSFVVFSDLY